MVDEQRMNDLFHALAHDARRAMLSRLASGELTIGQLAEPTGGSVIIASTVREVEAAAQRVAEELRQQYTLGFYPQNADGKTYHRLRVMTRHPDYRVRTRAGYLAANRK